MKLASIEQILEINVHPNADALEVAKVKGWNIVVKKGEFRVGQPCIYVQLDSVLPEKPEFEFLRQNKFRIKPIKLRKVMSQGIIFPLSILPDMAEDAHLEIYNGADVTKVLGITKYEKSIPIGGDQAGPFPTHLISKTDEERLQNFPELLDEIVDKKIVLTIKHDGTSSTFINADRFYACSRNWEIKEGNNVYWKMVEKYDLKNKISKGFAIQGEIVGPKIQNNPEGLTETKLRIFNIFNIETGERFSVEALRKFCEENYLDFANPTRIDFHLPQKLTLEIFEKIAERQVYENGKQAEGIVVRAEPPIYSRVLGGPLSFKVVNAEYAAKE